MKLSRKSLALTVGAISMTLVAGVVAAVVIMTKPAVEYVPPDPQTGTSTAIAATDTGGECAKYILAEATSCLKLYMQAMGQKGEIKPALAELDDLLNNPATAQMARAACHESTHLLGREAMRSTGDVEKAFALGGDTCNMGFYHGVVEELGAEVATVDELNAQVPGVCEGFRSSGERYSVCAHGVGHAAMLATGGALGDSIDTCRLFSNEDDARNCVTGVFMEWTNWFSKNVGRPNMTPGTASLQAGDLRNVYPPGLCVELTGMLRTACFNEMFGPFTGFASTEDMIASARWCGDQLDCAEGLGSRLPIIVSGVHDAGIEVCNTLTSDGAQATCLRAYGMTWGTYTLQMAEVDNFCRALPADRARICTEVKTALEGSELF